MAFWKSADEWSFETFGPDTPASELREFETLAEVWQSKRKGGGFPAWRDFDFGDFADWWGWLSVEDIVPDSGGDVRFRLWGTQIVESYGSDHTGKLMSETGGAFTDIDFEFAVLLASNAVIGYSTGTEFWQDPTYKTFAEIRLPLANDGKTIDKFLVGVSDLTERMPKITRSYQNGRVGGQ